VKDGLHVYASHAKFHNQFFKRQPQFALICGQRLDPAAFGVNVYLQQFAINDGKLFRWEVLALADSGLDGIGVFAGFLRDLGFIQLLVQAGLDFNQDAEMPHDHEENLEEVVAALKQGVERAQGQPAVPLGDVIRQLED